MMEIGYITAISGDYAVVAFNRKGGCGGSCACSTLVVTNEIRNTLGAKVGDKVKVEIQQKAFDKLLLWIYAFPLVMLVVGVGLGYKIFGSLGYSNTEVLSLILGVIALVISYRILRRVNKSTVQKQEDALQMIQIIK